MGLMATSDVVWPAVNRESLLLRKLAEKIDFLARTRATGDAIEALRYIAIAIKEVEEETRPGV